MLIVDLGALKIRSIKPADISEVARKRVAENVKVTDFEKAAESVYDNFTLTLSSIQALFIEEGKYMRGVLERF